MPTKTAFILMNLGTPVAPEADEVRSFLKTFLSDQRVVKLPRLIWWPLLNGIILRTRSPKVAQLYKKIWLDEGSPLAVITQRQVEKVQQSLTSSNTDVVVKYAMTYGEPSLQSVIRELEQHDITDVVLLPLYPQFSYTTTGSVMDQREALDTVLNVRLVEHYYDEAEYIAALAHSVEQHWKQFGRSERLLMSYHGIPQSYVDQGDPYYEHCQKTSVLLGEKLGLDEQDWLMSFQSRFGPSQWLQPYTDKQLIAWAEQGIRSVDVITPSFAADCLETLEEIEVEARELFIAHGGESLRLIGCLNDAEKHIELMVKIFQKQSGMD